MYRMIAGTAPNSRAPILTCIIHQSARLRGCWIATLAGGVESRADLDFTFRTRRAAIPRRHHGVLTIPPPRGSSEPPCYNDRGGRAGLFATLRYSPKGIYEMERAELS